MKFHHGEFTPKHPERYKGNFPIIYRSSWELKTMMVFDSRPDVIRWSSESIVIPYFHPIKHRTARYFPDFHVDFKDKEGNITRWIVEVKPAKECEVPVAKPRQRATTRMYNEQTFMINQAKWEAAEAYCRKNGLKFKVLTEKEIFANRR